MAEAALPRVRFSSADQRADGVVVVDGVVDPDVVGEADSFGTTWNSTRRFCSSSSGVVAFGTIGTVEPMPRAERRVALT